MFSCSHSIDDQPRPNNVFSIKTPFDARLSSALCDAWQLGLLLEHITSRGSLLGDVPWRVPREGTPIVLPAQEEIEPDVTTPRAR